MPITTVVKITRRSWSCSDQDLKIAISPLTLGRGEISHWSERTGHFHFCHGSRLQICFWFFLFFVFFFECGQTAVWGRWSLLVDSGAWDTHHLLWKLWELDGCAISGLLPCNSTVDLVQSFFAWNKKTQLTAEWWGEMWWQHVLGCSYCT